ncbi:hypothetical protein [Halobaculum gomorrense]|uniref:hypothetical protein n=1 Tax=Halobaculum gomorrense TaxID=43928 RepID=UPI000933B6A9|nr:hypothetical protein [Halobaculum gomorrense]
MSDTSETPSELLDAADDHDERAESLRREARRNVETAIRDQLDFEATVTAEHSGDGFVVEVKPDALSTVELDDDDLNVSVRAATLAIGAIEVDPETVRNIRELIDEIGELHSDQPGAPRDVIVRNAAAVGLTSDEAERELDKLRTRGEIYEPQSDYLRTT